jgi:hypothetical protein
MALSDAMTNAKQLLSSDLLHQVEGEARAQRRRPSELLEDAVRRYLKSQRLERFAKKAEQRARARGIRQSDVPRLVAEVRRQDRERGR